LSSSLQDRETKEALEDRYGVKSLPTLVLVDKSTGRLLSENAVAEVTSALGKTGGGDGAAQMLLNKWAESATVQVAEPAPVSVPVRGAAEARGGSPSSQDLVAYAALGVGLAGMLLWRASR
jgi:hypothetical protein